MAKTASQSFRPGRIIVLGMHRSGTSCVGNLLTKLGVYFGDDAISTGAGGENPKGFFERRDVRVICDAILQGSGSDWWAINNFSPERVPSAVRTEIGEKFGCVLEEMEAHHPWFIKEPRLCFVWPLLQAQVTDPVFVHVWRHPVEVARSLAARNGFPIDFGIALWEAYVRAAHVATRGQPSLLISYNALLKAPEAETRRLVKRLGELGIRGVTMPRKSALRDAIDPALYRNRQTSSELADLITPEQRRLIAALAKGSTTHPALFRHLSIPSRVRLQDWTRREGVILTLRNKVADARRATADVSKLRTALEQRDRKIASLESNLRARNQDTIDLERELERYKKAADLAQRLKGDLAKVKEEIRRSDAYIEQIKIHFRALQKSVEQQVAQILDKSDIDRAIEAARASALLADGGVSLKALLRGMRSAKPADQSIVRGMLALYAHYRWVKRRKDADDLVCLAGSGLFDANYYLEQYGDVAKSDADPLIHYMDFGAYEFRNPSPLFDTTYYLKANPHVAEVGLNPLLHFVLFGRREARLPRPPRAPRASIGDWTLPPAPAPAVPRAALKPEVKRVVIYTAVVGGYDDLKPPAHPLANCDFIVFSDQDIQVEGWQVRPLNYLHRDPTRAARFVKLHPHVYFPDYDHSIWIDANIGIQGDILNFFDCLTYESPIGIFIHPLRDCIYVEGAECIKRKKDSPEVINRDLECYRAEGFPDKAGLWETNVVVRRHNDATCVALMTAWWRELEIGSRRDQLSLPVVARRLSVMISPLGEPGANARNHELLTLVHHPKERLVVQNPVLPAPVRKNVDIGSISIDVAVCIHNSLAETRACLQSLIAGRRPRDGIILVDDASDAPTAEFLDRFAKEHEGVTLLRHRQNRGYTASANAALRESRADWIVLLNSDTVVPAKALRKLVVCGEQFANLGVVGPLSNAASWQTVPQLTGTDGKFLVNRIPGSMSVEDMDRICEELSTGAVLFVPLINGFCFAIRRALLQHIGFFDEQSFPMGYGEEDDFCLRAGAAGYLCGIATDTYVYHAKSASFTPERRAPLVEAGAKALRLKHSAERVEAAVDTMRGDPELERMREQIGELARQQSVRELQLKSQ